MLATDWKQCFLASWITRWEVYDSPGKEKYLWAELVPVGSCHPGDGSCWSGAVRQSLAVSHSQDNTWKGIRQPPGLKLSDNTRCDGKALSLHLSLAWGFACSPKHPILKALNAPGGKNSLLSIYPACQLGLICATTFCLSIPKLFTMYGFKMLFKSIHCSGLFWYN